MKFTIVSLIVLCFSKFVSFLFKLLLLLLLGLVVCGTYNTTFCVSANLYMKHVMHFAPVGCSGNMGRNHKS